MNQKHFYLNFLKPKNALEIFFIDFEFSRGDSSPHAVLVYF